MFAYGPADATASKSRLVLPFWYWLTEVVLKKRPLTGVAVVVVVVAVAVAVVVHFASAVSWKIVPHVCVSSVYSVSQWLVCCL